MVFLQLKLVWETREKRHVFDHQIVAWFRKIVVGIENTYESQGEEIEWKKRT